MTAKLIPLNRHTLVGAAQQRIRPHGSEIAPIPEQETAGVPPFGSACGQTPDDSRFDADGLLAACRDRLAHAVATAFAERLTGAAANLLALADRATRTDAQDLYYAAHGILAKHGQELLQQFRVEFVSACDAAFLALDQPMVRPTPPRFGELSLVADGDFERELTIGKLSSRANYNCSQPLTALDRRIATLRQGVRISQEDNPLYPKAIFAAFIAACQAQGACEEADLVLLQEFGHQIADALPNVYREINRYLVARNVLPDLPLGAAPGFDIGGPTADDLISSGSAEMAAVPHPPETPAPGPQGTADTGGAIPSDIFTLIANSLLASQPLPRPVPHVAPNPAPASAQAQAQASAQIIHALTQLQKGDCDAQQFPGIDPRQIDSTVASLLRRIRSTPLIAWSHPMDAITVDVVAMLFDMLLNDRELPDALRAEIGRLQIPILKVAMMDKEFFSDRQHPARRFLDAIAGSATGWREEELPRLLQEVRTVCEAVMDGFDKDITIFSSQLAVLTQFLADEEERGNETVNRRRGDVERAERNSSVRQEVSEQIRRHTSSPGLPDLIRDFLERFWRVTLVKAYLRPGPADQAWQNAIKTMDDLVWSVAPKTSTEERHRLFEILPGLLGRLRRGLASVELEDEWDGFFTRLIHMHMEAVRPANAAGCQGQTEKAAPVRGAPALALMSGGEAADPEGAAPNPRTGRDERYLGLARGLDLGAWIEFRTARGTRRALRLNWCSQQRGAYLFSNLQGDDTLIVATTRLAERLRDGSARILSRDSLTERAVSRLMATVAGDPAPDQAG